MKSPIAAGLGLLVAMVTGAAYAAELDSHVSSATYSLAPIRYGIEPKQELGKRKAGLICLPNGSVNFRDVRLPPTEAITKEVGEALASAGLKVEPPDPADFGERSAPYRIVATVVDIAMSVCAKRWGLGDGSSVKGTATVKIDWTVYQRARRERVAFATSHGSHATGSEAIDIGELVGKAVIDGAAQLARSPQGSDLRLFR